MSSSIITGGKSLAGLVAALFEEGVKSSLHRKGLQEKEKQAATDNTDNSSDDEGGIGLFGDDEGSSDASSDTDVQQTSKTGDDEKKKLEQGDVEPKDVIEKLNSIRSGRSFKDSAVGPAMEEYVSSLSVAERTALFAFLKGIAQIVTGEIPAQQAVEPDSNPSDVHMKKGPDVRQKTIQPNIIKKTSHDRPANNKAGSEDTSGPVPITPKRK